MDKEKTLVIVVSKAKQIMKDQDLSISMEAIEALSDQVVEQLKKAGEEARRNKRKVIKARDLKQG